MERSTLGFRNRASIRYLAVKMQLSSVAAGKTAPLTQQTPAVPVAEELN